MSTVDGWLPSTDVVLGGTIIAMFSLFLKDVEVVGGDV